MWRRSILNQVLRTALACAAIGPGGAWACGPTFPNSLLGDGDEAVTKMPVADFIFELNRLKGLAGPVAFPARLPDDDSDPWQQTAVADIREFTEALDAAKPFPWTRAFRIRQYTALREELSQFGRDLSQWRHEQQYAWMEKQPAPAPPEMRYILGLPGEFADYLAGARAYHRGDPTAARAAWSALLKREPRQRHYRTTWAAYMIGRTLVESNPEAAVRWFRRTRELAAAGFADSLGLAAASYGWEARAELERKRYTEAIELYLRHYASGDGCAVPSLQDAADRAFAADPGTLASLARHTVSRRVLGAFVAAKGGRLGNCPDPESVSNWLAAVEAAGVSDVEGADRLAWAAYLSGNMDLARRWADRAPACSPVAQWVRSKLLLRAGNVEQAAVALAAVVKWMPRSEVWIDTPNGSPRWDSTFRPADEAAGELAVLRLRRGQFIDSLDLFLRANFWRDAAHVAERVLTADELKAYVDARWPPGADPEGAVRPMYWSGGDRPATKPALGREIRHLLARRLVRLGRWREARPYFPDTLQPRLDAYIGAIRAGRDAARTADQRARSLLDAGRIARHDGIELLGTEVAPDFYCYDGAFEGNTDPTVYFGDAVLTAPTAEEHRRYISHAPTPDTRFHYRYIAAEHAWEAARLLPDQSELAAQALYEGGSWLKNRDPAAADRFYKALVRRCGATPLGRQAAALRWFPPFPEPPPSSR
jgi:hypothetical protein